MIRIAIVEDEEKACQNLQEMLGKYEQQAGENFSIQTFKNAIIFLTNYKADYDVIFMDIQMPHMDGMEAAAKLREIDSETILVFVTNMAGMAVKGYEVAAFDFVVKPLHYESLSMKMDRVIEAVRKKEDQKIILSSQGSKILLNVSDITYVEVNNHQLIYHTGQNEYASYGTIANAAKQLEGRGFALCNKCYLVNLKYVKSVHQFEVTVRNDVLQISHPKKKEFMEALNNYIGG